MFIILTLVLMGSEGEFNQEEFNKFIEDNNVYGFFQEAITLKSGRKSHFYAN